MNIFLENSDFLDTMISFFDLDQLIEIEIACAHDTLNLSCCIRLFNFRIRPAKSPSDEKVIISEKIIFLLQLLKIETQNSLHEMISISGFEKIIWPTNIFRKSKNRFC